MVAKTHPKGKVHVLIYPPTHKPSDIVDRLTPNAVPEVCLTWGLHFGGEARGVAPPGARTFARGLYLNVSRGCSGVNVYLRVLLMCVICM